MKVNLEDLSAVQVPVPKVGQDEVLIEVAGSSVNPVDWKLIESPLALTWSYPHVLGRDCAGKVVAVGADVERLHVGDAVWADAGGGCYGEYAALKASIVGKAPSSLPLPASAVLPLVGLTGMDALQKFAGAPWTDGKIVLVLGGSGGTGHVGIQLAKAWGASKVISTCGTSHIDFCAGLGADQVIDYRKEDWFTALGTNSVDIIYDCVGVTSTGGHAYDVLKDGGFFATLVPTALASPLRALQRRSIKQAFVMTKSSDYRDLEVLKELVDDGKLRSSVEKVFSIAEVATAVNASMGGHTAGKISVVPQVKFTTIV
jgi:NADPH:quinone reductase-like Zn-dependent oxidoreductase